MHRDLVTYATFLITGAACLAACADGFDSPGIAPPSTVAITFAATPAPDGLDEAAPPGEAEGGDDIDISRLQIQFENIELRPEEGEVQRFTDLQVDALDPIGRVVGLDAPAGTYGEVDLNIGVTDAGAGIDGSGFALLFEGTAGATRFTVRSRQLDRIRFDGIGLTVGDDGLAELAVDLDATRWLDGVDMAGMRGNADGVVVISPARPHGDAWRTIVANIRQQVRASRRANRPPR